MSDGDAILEGRGISKEFPGVRALDGVDLVLRPGRVTALLGENGAGKSTLMNILAGVFPPDTGEVRIGGRVVRFPDPHAARACGIATIFQELSLVPNLTVAENIFLGREPRTRLGFVDYDALHRETRDLLRRIGVAIAPDAVVDQLRVGQQQMIEIARALSSEPRVLIMDEPTSALSDREVEILFAQIAGLKAHGIAIVYITHRLEELARVADDVVILRDGRVVATAAQGKLSTGEIVRHMVGRASVGIRGATAKRAGSVVMRVDDISLREANDSRRQVVSRVSFELRAGEVLGIFGLMGAGRTELIETLFGLHAGRSAGRVAIGGIEVVISSPADAIRHGLVLAPEDRKRDGLVLDMSVQANAALASLDRSDAPRWLDAARERAQVAPLLERFGVRTNSWPEPARTLSGGNQQKVILAKWMATGPRILLLDEPTRGIDVGAKGEIYALIEELAGRGLGVVVVSSELPEILALADRLLVMSEGRVTAEFSRAGASPEAVMRAALPCAA